MGSKDQRLSWVVPAIAIFILTGVTLMCLFACIGVK